jgi:hypothetical protein
MSSYSESRAKARDRMQTAAREIEKLKGKIAELRNQKMSDKEKKAFSLQKLFQKSATPNRDIATKVSFFVCIYIHHMLYIFFLLLTSFFFLWVCGNETGFYIYVCLFV